MNNEADTETLANITKVSKLVKNRLHNFNLKIVHELDKSDQNHDIKPVNPGSNLNLFHRRSNSMFK